MANPPNPTNPNITTGALTGRVVTDRYDFEKHVVGESFKHDGYSIVLAPPVTINSVQYSNATSAISQLANLINPPPPPDATVSVKGIVRLSGDLAGTGSSALTPRVSGLQGQPVNTAVPSINQVLTWNGAAWGPAAPANTFTAGNDLSGTNISQSVLSVTGTADDASIKCQFLTWIDGKEPTLRQVNTTGTPFDMYMIAQTTTNASENGGTIRLIGGLGGASSLDGGVSMEVDGYHLVHVANTLSNNKVVALCGVTDVTSTEMPANTGDRVIYIRNAQTAPTSGNPVNGSILYSQADGLWTKNSAGQNFAIGTLKNPNIWGVSSTSSRVYEFRDESTTTTGTQNFGFLQDLNTAGFTTSLIKVEAVIVGRQDDAGNGLIHTLTHAYMVQSNGTPTAVGSLISTDPRSTGAGGWTVPTITTVGTQLRVLTGANAATTIKWFVYTRLTISAV